MISYIIGTIIILYLIFIIFLYIFSIKIDKFEENIIQLFKEKNNQIPSIYEITKKYLKKHDEIFSEAISLKRKDFSENCTYNKLIEKSNTYKKIHYELNFIFKVCNKNQKLNKNGKYLYLRDIIIDKSLSIGEKLTIYKNISKKYNKLVLIKNMTIVGLLFPIFRKKII